MWKSAFLGVVFTLSAIAQAGAETVLRAQDFADRFGVNLHMSYTDSSYVSPEAVLKALRYTGITHVRDNVIRSNMQGQAKTAYQELFAAGIFFCFVANTELNDALANLRDVAKAFPNAIDAIEGPNEVNNYPIPYGGKTGTEGAQAYQAALYAAVKGDSSLAHVPVYNFTDYPEKAGRADFVNVHPYPKQGQQPRNTIAANIGAYAPLMPSIPPVITEGGYYTLPGPHGWGGVDEATHAKLMLNFYLDAIEQGARRVHTYQLLDAYPDPAGTNQEKHFGLFDTQYRPKPAATALRNLLMLVHDNGESARTFAPTPVAYSLAGLPPTARSLLLQRSDGWGFLIVWDEPAVWDANRFQPIPAKEVSVTLKFPAPRATVTVDDVIQGSVMSTMRDTSTVALHLTDTPLLIVFSPS